MTSRRVTFSDKQNVHEIPNDAMSIIARKKFSSHKPTKYDPHNCEICKISCNSKIIYDMHVMGKKHNKALDKLEELRFPCGICSLTLEDLDSWEIHLKSFQHIQNQQKSFSLTIEQTPNFILNNINYCDACKLDCGSNIILQSHLTGSKHRRKLKVLKIEKLKESKDSSVYCEICDISLEPELMLLHKQSGKHKKVNIKDNKINPKAKNGMEFCAICDQEFSEIGEAIEHYKSTDHLHNVKNKENIFWCEVCKIILPNESMLNIHLQGFRHYRILKREECSIEGFSEGTYKEKLLLKRLKQKELRVQFENEKNSAKNIINIDE